MRRRRATLGMVDETSGNEDMGTLFWVVILFVLKRSRLLRLYSPVDLVKFTQDEAGWSVSE